MAACKKPFYGRRIFLDLKAYKNQEELVKALTKLGAKIESFFSRDVNLVLTDREIQSYYSSQASPCNVPSPNGNSVVMPRSLAIVQKAVQKNCGSSDLLAICKKWHIKVTNVKKALAVISMHHIKSSKCNNENKAPLKTMVDLANLPSMKIENIKCTYQPIHQTFKNWKFLVNSKICHFINNLQLDLQQNVSTNVLRPLQNTMKAPKTPFKSFAKPPPVFCKPKCYEKLKKPPQPKKILPKKQFCEICQCTYIDLHQHLKTSFHSKFMKNEAAFEPIYVAMKGLPTVAEFLLKNDVFSKENDLSMLIDDSGYLESQTSPLFHEISLLTNEVIPASCSSDKKDVPQFPYLESHNNHVLQGERKFLEAHAPYIKTDFNSLFLHDYNFDDPKRQSASRTNHNDFGYVPETTDSDVALDLTVKRIVQEMDHLQSLPTEVPRLENCFLHRGIENDGQVIRSFPFRNFGHGWSSPKKQASQTTEEYVLMSSTDC